MSPALPAAGRSATAAVARASNRPFALESVEIDGPRADEAVVRVKAVGICHTDLAFRDTAGLIALPAILGHEGAGVIEEVGAAVTKVGPGDPVLLTFASCGGCRRCEAGRPAYCESFAALNFTGRRPDGSGGVRQGDCELSGRFFGQSSFATRAIVSERNLVRADPDIPLELLAPLGCSVQTGAGAVMRSLDCQPGGALLVTGGGAVGMCAVIAARLRRLDPVILVEPIAARRALALRLGATHVLDWSDNVAAQVRAIMPEGVDYALDTTGRGEVLEAALAGLGTLGTLGLVAAEDGAAPPPGQLAGLITLGQSIKGIIEGDSDPEVFIPELIELYRQGLLPLDELVTCFPFEQINGAIEAQHRGECLKAVLLMEEG